MSAAEELLDVPRGLKNVVVAETGIGGVRGMEGFYHYRQYAAVDLAAARSLEDIWFLLVEGHLPDRQESREFTAAVAAARTLPQPVWDALPALAAVPGNGPLDALRTALSLLGAARKAQPVYDLTPAERRHDALAMAAAVPVLVAALHRLSLGQAPVAPRGDLGHAADYLFMLTGAEPDPRHARAVEQYLALAVDHGFNASTFTARVIASTGADVAACLVGALGALSGPLHGGAPSRALEALTQIGSRDRIDPWVRERVLSGSRIMGFGHPVYRTEDPRSRMLHEVAVRLTADDPAGRELVDFAAAVEERVVALLAELKPGRALHTNVEYYAGVVMKLAGLPESLFTPTFAVARVIGWVANILEQADDTKIIRPTTRYVGPTPPQEVPAA